MIKFFIKLSVVFCSASLFACSSANNKPLLISFSADSSSVVFSNVDQPGLLHLKNILQNDPHNNFVFNELITVLQTPSEKDTSIKEMPVDGKILVTDSNIIFIPEKPFVKGSDYLVITHLNARFGNAEKLLKGELSYGVRPLQKLLSR